MGSDGLHAIEREIDRQNEELAELEQTLRRLDHIEVPPSFFADLEEACEVRAAPAVAATAGFLLHPGLRA